MDINGSFAILSLAFGLGMLHALDADHIMAVSGLAARRPSLRGSLRFCVRWAIGHGLVLLLIGGAVLLLGMAIPETLSSLAELLVGIVLITIGAWVLWDLIKQRTHLHFHAHDHLPQHAHWHSHGKKQAHNDAAHRHELHRHEHSAVLVGLLHGTAGSAPFLALLPMSAMNHSPWHGMLYLFLFCGGVLLSMFIFGGLLGSTFHWLTRWGNRSVQVLRSGVALSAMGFGSYLLVTGLPGAWT